MGKNRRLAVCYASRVEASGTEKNKEEKTIRKRKYILLVFMPFGLSDSQRERMKHRKNVFAHLVIRSISTAALILYLMHSLCNMLIIAFGPAENYKKSIQTILNGDRLCLFREQNSFERSIASTHLLKRRM